MQAAAIPKNAIVKLNVGGISYTTTRDTLCLTSKSSFFTSLLSGKFEALTDDTGAIFIDRPGEPFGVILGFLRTQSVKLPKDMGLDEVRTEAEFYCISDLIDALDHLEPVNPNTHLTPRRDGYYVCGEMIPPTTFSIGSIAFRTDSDVVCARPLVSENHNDVLSRSTDGTVVGQTRHQVFPKALPLLQKASKTPDIWKDSKSDTAYANYVQKVMFRGKYTSDSSGFFRFTFQGKAANVESVYFGMLLEGQLFIAEADSEKARFFEFRFVQSDIFVRK